MDRSSDAPAIAVVGMAGRFPGARDVEELWDNLSRGVESIRTLTPEEMRAAGVDPAQIADPRWVPAAGVLEGADLFDAAFFQIPPREAELLDPQHRVFLECAWEALEDAGCDPARFAGAIGAFAGAGLNTYLLHNLLPGGESVVNPQVAIANDKDFLTTRLSYKLDLKGPSLDVQTGCSTSLVAVVLACQSLLNFQCDLALAGGVAVREPQRAGYLYQENGILSPDGHCRPFDAAAAGTVPGNGVGVVVLKRLEDALADGDTVRAVILGAALNNDGSSKVGFTAPGVAGQAEVIATALAVAGVRPEEVSYVEAHGTATPMGDPIEVRALDRVFGGAGKPGFCALGSLKSNLGHLDAAAGVAGLIKTILALEHRQIPPTVHFTRPHPDAGLEGGPFYIPAELRSWETDALPRRAGVSSFGIGGTNAHVVLEEAPPRPAPAGGDGPEMLVLSARTAMALDAATARLATHLERHPELSLRDVAHTLRAGRRPMEARRAVAAHDIADAVVALRSPDRWLTEVEVDGSGLPGGRRVPLPTYPFERERFWIEPKRPVDSPKPSGLRLRTPLWKQAIAGAGRKLPADGSTWLVFPGTEGVGSQLLARLQAERLEPVAVTPGPGFSRISAGSFSVDPGSAADHDALLDVVLAAGRPLRIVHLAGAESLEQLAAALHRRSGDPSIRLDVIVTGVLDPTGGPSTDPALHGICRGLNSAEMAGITCRLVDAVPPRLLEQVHAELAAPAGPETAVARRGRHRWVEVWEELPATPASARSEGAWLVAGDAEEAAHELARLLAARPGAKVVIRGAGSGRWDGLDAWMKEITVQVTADLPPGGAREVAAATDALCTSHVAAALRSRGIELARGADLSLAELRRSLRLVPGQERLFQALLRMLREDGWIELRGEAVHVLRDFAEILPPADVRQAREAEAPQLRGLFDLLDHCGRHLSQVLAGEIPGLSVLYPEGSSDELARAVQAAESEGPRDAAPLLLRELLRVAQERQPGRSLRILEVGAGQGTLTREILPVLAGGAEYWFTDIGRSFVLAAEEKGGESLRFAVLDITRDPSGQGIPLGFFDAVVGANVVHATPRIEETLGHLRALLAPGGLLALMETVRRQRWADLVWGLTEGWWSFADAPLRTESPLLDPEGWQTVLGRAGFEEARPWPPAEDTEDVETALLLARTPAADVAAQQRLGPLHKTVHLTRNPALAVRDEEHVTLFCAGQVEAADLAAALDLAVDAGLFQVAVSRTGASATPAPLPAPAEIPAEPPPAAALHGRPQLMTPYLAPRTGEERTVAEIWQRALGIDRVGVHDNFLELGGDSLIGLQVVSAIRERFPTLQTTGGGLSLYEHSTVAAIARFLAGAGTFPSEASETDDSAQPADAFELRSSRGERRRERRGSFKRMR